MTTFKSQPEMTSLPDKYLREKFAQHRKSPPSQAWNRIQIGLNKNKSGRMWLRIAAAVLMFLTTSITLWEVNKSATIKQATASENAGSLETTIQPFSPIASPAIEKYTSPAVRQEINAETRITSSARSFKTKQNNLNQESEISIDVTSATTAEATPLVTDHSIPESITEQVTPDAEPANMPTHQGKKIYYSVADVNARFLKKKDDVALPSPLKPETGFQKILDIAYDLKYDESALGDLRQFKNDLLSFPAKKTSGKNN